MKPDTFDIPAYKFAIKLPNGDYVPFENFDGLTLGEVYSLIWNTLQERKYTYDAKKRPIIFVSYFGEDCPNKKELFSLTFSKEKIDENKDLLIDKIIEKDLEILYDVVDKLSIKKSIRCFFERYQDKNHQDTLSRIKKISN